MTDTVAARPENVQRVQRRRARMAQRARDQKTIRELITPEGAVLKLRIASASERAGAFIIDFIILIVTLILGLIAIGYLAVELGFAGWNIAGAIAMLFAFTLRNFYFIFFEMGRRAATPGKRLLGLRVAARNGGRLTANAVFARNFLREIEVFLPLSFLLGIDQSVNGWIALMGLIWSGLFLLFPMFNRDKLRSGDIIAGTWVIHAPKVTLEKDVTTDRKQAPDDAKQLTFTAEQLSTYGVYELQVLEGVLRQSNDRTKKDVASEIRKKISWSPSSGETDIAFLNAFYAALRRHLEQRLLMGDRKQDQFDG
ncbi:MAG: RDD family protein [Pseudomonadota bacterium]